MFFLWLKQSAKTQINKNIYTKKINEESAQYSKKKNLLDVLYLKVKERKNYMLIKVYKMGW